MFRLIVDTIYGVTPARFDAPHEPEEAALLLRGATPGSSLATLFVESVVGRVSVERVRLHRYKPFLRIGATPVFRGRFVRDSGRTVLQGEFGLQRVVQAFMTLWFCCVGVWCLVAPGLGIRAAIDSGQPWWTGVIAGLLFSLAGLLLAAGAYAILEFSKRLARSDIERIEKHIRTALARTGV